MNLGTPRSEQGQIVEPSYGWLDGNYYQCVYDQSDRTVRWYIADDESTAVLAGTSYDAGGENHPPRIAVWTRCDDPEGPGYTLDGEFIVLDEFLADNPRHENFGVDPEAIRALRPGGSITYGGGAQPVTVLRRVR